MPEPTSIGTRLREERVRLDLNQEDFAATAHTTKRSQYEYEKDGALPAPRTLPQSPLPARMCSTL